jgi:hypothetical protein
MVVALALSSQKPGESESCLSFAVLASLFSTSKKSLQNHCTVSQSLNLFYCHAAKVQKGFVLVI